MRAPGRGDWVAVTVATAVQSYSEGPDGAAVGGDDVGGSSSTIHHRETRTERWCRHENDDLTKPFLKQIQHDTLWKQYETLNFRSNGVWDIQSVDTVCNPVQHPCNTYQIYRPGLVHLWRYCVINKLTKHHVLFYSCPECNR